METVACDLCGASDTDTIIAAAEWPQEVPDGLALVKCRRCGLMYLNPRPSPSEIGSYYPPDYTPFRPAVEDEKSALMRWARRRKLRLRRHLVQRYSGQKTGRLLDVGCSTGLFIHEMARSGWQVNGIEPAPSAAQYARSRFGLDVFEGTLETADFPQGLFDVVTFWDVLEHTHSPSATLESTCRLLRRGGMVAINAPNWDSLDRRLFGKSWIGYDPPRHLFVFTHATLTRLLEKSGFQIVAWNSFMPSFFPFVISLNEYLRARSVPFSGQLAQFLQFPGVRYLFEPWFALANHLGLSSLMAVWARRR